jgi:hypothetical protein
LLSHSSSSTVIEDIIQHRQSGAAIAYFYFNFRDSAKQTYLALLKSLVVQLCLQSVVAFGLLEGLYDRSDHGQQMPDSLEILKALKLVVEALPHAFIIVDALNECSEREEVLSCLSYMSEWKLDKLHVLVTSRLLTDIEETLDSVGARRVALQRNLVDPDIHAYVRTCLREDKSLKRMSAIYGEIEASLTEGAHGMYETILASMRFCHYSCVNLLIPCCRAGFGGLSAS